MINYNPKDWFVFIFRFPKVDTFRKLLPLMIAISFYTGIIAYLEMDYLKLSENSHAKNVTIMHNLLGFVLSLLLVFRTNTAYDRWWEGRKLWGSLTNNSRNLALKLSPMLTLEEDRVFFKNIIPSFAKVLKDHLRSEKRRIELFDPVVKKSKKPVVEIDEAKHIPNQIAQLMFEKVHHLLKDGKITGEQLLFLNNELLSFTDICGACERIRNTPIPYSYSMFIKKFIFFYIMSLPVGFVFNLGYYAIPVVTFIFYVLASLELIAEEIEEPFGRDGNDLPLDKMARNIEKHVGEILDME
jgi:ion channel-forming bestrophin family protein